VVSAVATGVLTGLIAIQAVARLERGRAAGSSPLPASDVSDSSDAVGPEHVSSIRRLRSEVKIAAVVVVGLAVVVVSDFRLYAAVLGLLVVSAVLGRARLSRLVAGLKRVWVLLAVSLVMPVLFSPWGRILLQFGPLRVTEQGMYQGAIFASRILLLFFATAVLAETTTPEDLASGLERLLAPLRVFRVRPGRLARSLSLSWSYFPVFWQSVRQMASRSRELARQDGRGWFTRVIHLPGDVVADMYLLAERTAARAAAEVVADFRHLLPGNAAADAPARPEP
jgi:energy-coupling factor transport system permease protein